GASAEASGRRLSRGRRGALRRGRHPASVRQRKLSVAATDRGGRHIAREDGRERPSDHWIRGSGMTDRTIDLDTHRGMAAQKATELRRLLADVEANEKSLRLRQDELEMQLVAAPATSWHDAADKARYLLKIFAT